MHGMNNIHRLLLPFRKIIKEIGFEGLNGAHRNIAILESEVVCSVYS
jgi:hypothetical protein